MPPLSGAKLQNILNTTLKFFFRGPAFESSIQARPLLKALRGKQKMFPGGQDTLSFPVKGGNFQIGFSSYTNDDTVTYGDTNRVQRAEYIWREYHAGITLTATELKNAGFTLTDDTAGIKAAQMAGSDKIRLTNLLEDKMTDMNEGMMDSLNTQYWEDGTGSATDILGVTGMITDDPTTGTIAGIDRSTNAFWRNVALTADHFAATADPLDNLVTSSTADGGALLQAIQRVQRQLQRFGGKPNIALCGSTFLEAMEVELRANGNYSLTGFSGGNDISVGPLKWKGIEFVYDPTLDATVGGVDRSKFCYMIDQRYFPLYTMVGEDFKVHNPARPEDQYVVFKAVTWTGAICPLRFNTHAVIEIA